MPVDTSMYNTAPPQPVNPLAIAGQALGVQGAVNQNRLFQQDFAAKQAIGQAYQSATDPVTGQLDNNKFSAAVAGNPAASFLAGSATHQNLENQQAQTALRGQQLQQAKEKLDWSNQALGNLALNPNAGPQDVYSTLKDGIHRGILSADEAIETAKTMPPPEAGPQALQQWIQQHQMNAMGAAKAFDVAHPDPTLINTGPNTIVAQIPRTGGAPTINATIANGMSPSDASSPVTYFDKPTQTMKTVTKAEFVQMQGGGTGGAPSPMGNGSFPTPSPAAPAPNGQPAPQGGPGIAAAPALGAGVAADVAAKGSADALNNLHADIANSGTRIYQLQAGLQALQGASTGKGSQTPQDVQSFIQTISPTIAQGLHIDPQKIANYDEATKYLTGYAQNQAGNFGAHTDSQLATALTANPSTHISNLAATDVVKANIGLERMKQAQAQAFDQSGLPPEQFNTWQVGWNKTVDPRAYMVDQLTPEKYTAMVSGMKPAEKANFYKSLNSAWQSGFVALPGQPQAQPGQTNGY